MLTREMVVLSIKELRRSGLMWEMVTLNVQGVNVPQYYLGRMYSSFLFSKNVLLIAN